MAFYHVGSCDCPSGCCSCGDNLPPEPTEVEKLKENIRRAKANLEKYTEDLIFMIENPSLSPTERVLVQWYSKTNDYQLEKELEFLSEQMHDYPLDNFKVETILNEIEFRKAEKRG